MPQEEDLTAKLAGAIGQLTRIEQQNARLLDAVNLRVQNLENEIKRNREADARAASAWQALADRVGTLAGHVQALGRAGQRAFTSQEIRRAAMKRLQEEESVDQARTQGRTD